MFRTAHLLSPGPQKKPVAAATVQVKQGGDVSCVRTVRFLQTGVMFRSPNTQKSCQTPLWGFDTNHDEMHISFALFPPPKNNMITSPSISKDFFKQYVVSQLV